MFYNQFRGVTVVVWLCGLLLGSYQSHLLYAGEEDSNVMQNVASGPSPRGTLGQRALSLPKGAPLPSSSAYQSTALTDTELVSILIDREEHLLRRFKRHHGEQTSHPDIALSLNNLGVAFTKLGKLQEGLDYQKRSLKMHQALYPDQPHPDVVASLSNVSRAYQVLGHEQESLNYLDQALTMRRRLPESAPAIDVAMSLNNAGMAYQARGEFQKAFDYLEQSLVMYQTLLHNPKSHPTLACILHNMGTAYEELGNLEEGINYQIQALEMRKRLLHSRSLPAQDDPKFQADTSSAFGDEAEVRRGKSPPTQDTPAPVWLSSIREKQVHNAMTVGPGVAWIPGPHMQLSSEDVCREVYNIPVGYRYKGYRIKPGSIVQRASCTIRYVEANSEEEIQRLIDTQGARSLEGTLSAEIPHVATLGSIEGGIRRARLSNQRLSQSAHFKHAALIARRLDLVRQDEAQQAASPCEQDRDDAGGSLVRGPSACCALAFRHPFHSRSRRCHFPPHCSAASC